MNQKALSVALIGAANAGKSTLTNALSGLDLAQVSPKKQTTRNNLRAIFIRDNLQIVFTDTPGLSGPRDNVGRFMHREAWSECRGADKVLFIIDACVGISAENKKLLSSIKRENKSLVINKIDKVSDKKILLDMSREIFKIADFERVFMISALKKKGLTDLKKFLENSAEERPWDFPEDILTDVSQAFIATEITRKSIFLETNRELPYSIAVTPDSWQEKETTIFISQTIRTLNERHKKILIGSGGNMLRKIGERSRKEIGFFTKKKVDLRLTVKNDPGWPEDFSRSGGFKYLAMNQYHDL